MTGQPERSADDLIETGLRAWIDGDVETLGDLLDPEVRLESADGCGRDCAGRQQVLTALQVGREITDPSQHPRRTERLGDGIFVVSPIDTAAGAQSRTARITVKAGRIVRLQQFSSPDAAFGTPDPIEDAAVRAIRAGDVRALQQVLADHPRLASARLRNHGGRTLLHVTTDWPGHYPNVGASIAALVAAGADVDAPTVGDHPETPLHWAASSDDLEALNALLDAGADIEARGGVIGGGTPLSDAAAFGQWNAARRLVERGAQAQMWEAAALGLLPLLQQYVAGADPVEITHSFWCACHGDQPEAAQLLLANGAEINWIGYDGLSPLDAARRSGGTNILSWLTANGAASAASDPPAER